MPVPDAIIASNRNKVVAIIQGMLDGSVRVVDGALALDSLRHEVGLDPLDSDFLPFLNFADEVDQFPVGAERQYWAPDVLPRKEAELEQREAAFREKALQTCRRLLARFASGMSFSNASNESTPTSNQKMELIASGRYILLSGGLDLYSVAMVSLARGSSSYSR